MLVGPQARMQTYQLGQVPDVADVGGCLRGGGPSDQVGRIPRQPQLAHALTDPRHGSQVIVPVGHEDGRTLSPEKRCNLIHAVEQEAVERRHRGELSG